MSERITIIVPFLNAAATLERCLTAVENQSLPRSAYRIVAIDNGSTDASAAIARMFPDVMLLTETKRGSYAARNRGLREVTSEFVAFTDPDCVPRSDWLQHLIAAFSDPEVVVVAGRTVPAGRTRSLVLLAAYEDHKDAFVHASADPVLYYGHTNNMAARHAALREHGPFEERARGADTIFVRRVVDAHGCDAVRYERLARASHLEVDTTSRYFSKVYTYARSQMGYSQVVPARPLAYRERLGVLATVLRAEELSVAGALHLGALLAVGATCWQAGSLTGRSARSTRPSFPVLYNPHSDARRSDARRDDTGHDRHPGRRRAVRPGAQNDATSA